MKCYCCNKTLSNFEATRKDTETGVYLDLCNECFHVSGVSNLVHVTERNDLGYAEDMEDDDMELHPFGHPEMSHDSHGEENGEE